MKRNFSTVLLFIMLSGILACKHEHFPGGDNHQKLELVFKDSAYQLTGVAKQQGGLLLVNYPRWSAKYKNAVVSVQDTTHATPYPDEAMNSWQPGTDGRNKWVCVQSVYVDDDNTIWVLDPAAPFLKTIQGQGAKLVKMLGNGKMPMEIFDLNTVLPDTAYANDVRIDVRKQFAYLTESKGGGIIVIDLATHQMRRVLAGHYSVISDPAYKFIIDGRELMKDGKPAKFNSDGIALTPDGKWLYYKPLSDDKLYRIETQYLRDWNLSGSALERHVQDLGHFSTTDGMIFDRNGNLYMGDLQHYRLIKITPNLAMHTIVQDPRLIWPDSYSIAGGYLYVSCSQIQKQPEYNNGIDKRTSPYTVYRIRID